MVQVLGFCILFSGAQEGRGSTLAGAHLCLQGQEGSTPPLVLEHQQVACSSWHKFIPQDVLLSGSYLPQGLHIMPGEGISHYARISSEACVAENKALENIQRLGEISTCALNASCGV